MNVKRESLTVSTLTTEGTTTYYYVGGLTVCLQCQTPRQRQRPIKVASVEFCGGVCTAQRPRPILIFKGSVYVLSVCVGLDPGVGQCE